MKHIKFLFIRLFTSSLKLIEFETDIAKHKKLKLGDYIVSNYGIKYRYLGNKKFKPVK